LESYRVLTGGLYVFRRKDFIESNKIIQPDIYTYKVKGKYALDIDNSNDINTLKKFLNNN